MIDNNKKIEKLNQLLSFAIENMSISHLTLSCDDDAVWKHIDKIIKINDYIEKLKDNTPAQEKETNESSLYHS